MDKIPWFLTIFFGSMTVWSWTSNQSPVEESTSLASADHQIGTSSETKKKEVILPVEQKILGTTSVPLSPKIQEIIQDPEVATYMEQEIERRALQKAKLISVREIEDYKKDEKTKESEEVHTYMDNLEAFFMDSVDAYAEEFTVDEDTKFKLAKIVGNGFQKQRLLYNQRMENEISEEEYERLSAEAKKEDREDTIELLGEEGAEDFGTVLKQEGQRAKERDAEE